MIGTGMVFDDVQVIQKWQAFIMADNPPRKTFLCSVEARTEAGAKLEVFKRFGTRSKITVVRA